MPYNPDQHHRHTIRLPRYDYRRVGLYFVTICTQDRACLFGEVSDGEMHLGNAGQMVRTVWDEIPATYPGTQTDAFVIMPNHIHGIITIAGMTVGSDGGSSTTDGGPATRRGQARGPAPTILVDDPANGHASMAFARALSLPDVVHRFKTLTTKRYADAVRADGWPPFRIRLWQRNYYEHVIRGPESLDRIRAYIIENPLRWASDRENPLAADFGADVP